MSSASAMIEAIRVFQDARKNERVAREALAEQLFDHLEAVANVQRGGSHCATYDASDLRQSVIRVLAEDDFRTLAELDVTDEKKVTQFFRTVVRNKLRSVLRAITAIKRGAGRVAEFGDFAGEVNDPWALSPDTLMIGEEELARWEAAKDLLSARDRKLIDLAETYWKRGEHPDWTRIAGLLSEVTPDTYRVRCYHFRMSISNPADGPEGVAAGTSN